MEINEGDLIITLPKVERIKAILGKVKAGMIGVVIETNPKFNGVKVYGVAINGIVYYLFEDEFKKLEEEC